MNGDFIFYEFSRSKVERCDFAQFLCRYAIEKLPRGRALRAVMGTMLFCINGYDEDLREVQTIPEVRKFYSAFHAAWPYWLYFCSLEEDTLKPMVFSCLNSIAGLKVDGQPECLLECDENELRSFLYGDLAPMKEMCLLGGMFENLVQMRVKAVFEYFGLRADLS